MTKKNDALEKMYRELAEKEKSYRARALKMYPHVCASCSREFSGKGLKELTVHHKDHNHDNNPLDGSNWELLCTYCHENEHARFADEMARDRGPDPGTPGGPQIRLGRELS